jgi:hypothetical protein
MNIFCRYLAGQDSSAEVFALNVSSKFIGVLLLSLVSLGSVACGGDLEGGVPQGFVEGEPQPDDGPEQTPDMGGEAMTPDASPDGGPTPEPETDPEPEPQPDVSPDDCVPELYREVTGVFSGTLTTITSGDGIPSQTTTSEITIDFDETDPGQSASPNCTFTRTGCFFEAGSTLVMECVTNGIETNATTTTLSAQDDADVFSMRSASETSNVQGGSVISASDTDMTFTLRRTSSDTVEYIADVETVTEQGIFSSLSTGTLSRQ